MSKYISVSIIALFVAASAACSKKDEESVDIDATLDVVSEKIEEVGGGTADMASKVRETASELVDESASGITEAVDDAKGQLADMGVDDAQGMTDEVSKYADEMPDNVIDEANEEAKGLEEEAKKKLNIGN